MTVLRVQDRALLTATELTLIESSTPSRIRAYTSAQLNNRIVRMRRFWDKSRELTCQQQLTTKTSRQRSRLLQSPNARTERKAQVFARALDRFEKRLEQLTREEGRRPCPQATPVSKRSRRPVAQRDTIRRETQQGRAPRITRQFKKSKMRAIQGHISARGKRRQAKLDARR